MEAVKAEQRGRFAVTGARTTIVAKLARLSGCDPVRIDADLAAPGCTFRHPEERMVGWRYVLAAGYLAGKTLNSASADELARTWLVNFVNTARLGNEILQRDPMARVCVVGSMSALDGSFDLAYAGAKAALHLWAETTHLSAGQQLVVVAPPIIADSGMTERRPDYPAILSTRPHVTAWDVASTIHAALWAPVGVNARRTGVLRVAPVHAARWAP